MDLGSTRTPKYGQEMRFQRIPDLIPNDLPSAFPAEAGHPPVCDAARDDEVEEVEVGVEVEGEAVHGHPPAALDPDGTDLPGGEPSLWVHPDSSEPVDAAGLNPPVRAGADDGFLQLAQVPSDVGAELVEVEDGVRHELSGPVVGDVPAAVDFVVFHAELCEALG